MTHQTTLGQITCGQSGSNPEQPQRSRPASKTLEMAPAIRDGAPPTQGPAAVDVVVRTGCLTAAGVRRRGPAVRVRSSANSGT